MQLRFHREAIAHMQHSHSVLHHVLCCAALCCAALCCAVLCCAVLCCAVLRCAALSCAVLRCAAQKQRALLTPGQAMSQSCSECALRHCFCMQKQAQRIPRLLRLLTRGQILCTGIFLAQCCTTTTMWGSIQAPLSTDVVAEKAQLRLDKLRSRPAVNRCSRVFMSLLTLSLV